MFSPGGSAALYEVKGVGASPLRLLWFLIRNCEVVGAHDLGPIRRGPPQPESDPV